MIDDVTMKVKDRNWEFKSQIYFDFEIFYHQYIGSYILKIEIILSYQRFRI